MGKTPTVIGVLTEPAAPSWWQAHRHKLLLVVGLLVGYWLGTHTADAAPARPQPGPPAHTTPAHGTHALARLAT